MLQKQLPLSIKCQEGLLFFPRESSCFVSALLHNFIPDELVLPDVPIVIKKCPGIPVKVSHSFIREDYPVYYRGHGFFGRQCCNNRVNPVCIIRMNRGGKKKPDGVFFFPVEEAEKCGIGTQTCLLYTSPSPRDGLLSRM